LSARRTSQPEPVEAQDAGEQQLIAGVAEYSIAFVRRTAGCGAKRSFGEKRTSAKCPKADTQPL
jgi:hypothetical protein